MRETVKEFLIKEIQDTDVIFTQDQTYVGM